MSEDSKDEGWISRMTGGRLRWQARRLPQEVVIQYGDVTIDPPEWYRSPTLTMGIPLPPGSGVGYVQSPYTRQYDVRYGLQPIKDLQAYRKLYRTVPGIKTPTDKEAALAASCEYALEFEKTSPKLLDTGEKGGEHTPGGEGETLIEDEEPEEGQVPGEGKPSDKKPKPEGEAPAKEEEGKPEPEEEPGKKPKPKVGGAALSIVRELAAIFKKGTEKPEAEPTDEKPVEEGKDTPEPKNKPGEAPADKPEGKPGEEKGKSPFPPKEGEDKGEGEDSKPPIPPKPGEQQQPGPGGLPLGQPVDPQAQLKQEILDYWNSFFGKLSWYELRRMTFLDMKVYGGAFWEKCFDELEAATDNPPEAPEVDDSTITKPELERDEPPMNIPVPPDVERKQITVWNGKGELAWLKALDPVYMRVRRDPVGNIFGYLQWLAWPPVAFRCEKVIHIRHNRASWAYDDAYGTSDYMSVLPIQDQIWKLEDIIMTTCYLYTSPMAVIRAGIPPARRYTDPQVSQIRTYMQNRQPGSHIIMAGDCDIKVEQPNATGELAWRFLTYLLEQRNIAMMTPPGLMGIEEGGGSFAREQVKFTDYKMIVRTLIKEFVDAIHDQLLLPETRRKFGEDAPVPELIPEKYWEEDKNAVSARAREDYKAGLITKRMFLVEVGYPIDEADPDLDEYFSQPVPILAPGFQNAPPALGDEEDLDEEGEPIEEEEEANPEEDKEIVDEKGPRKKMPRPPKPPAAAGEQGQPIECRTQFLLHANGFKIWLVDVERVHGVDPRWGKSSGDFIGGHHLAPGMGYIPPDEIWISSVVEEAERRYVIMHELVEAPLMLAGMSYAEAHEEAKRRVQNQRQVDKELEELKK